MSIKSNPAGKARIRKIARIIPSRLAGPAALALCIFVLDQASKIVVLRLAQETGSVFLARIGSVFNIILTWNYGVVFGLFSNNSAAGRAVLLSVTAFITGIVLWLIRHERNTMRLWALASVFGGAVGNMADRVRLGGVVDFLDFHIGSWHWPAFNIADIGITLGVLCYAASLMFGAENQADNT